MMKKNIKAIMLVLISMVIMSENISAQNVGVNTLTPRAALEVKGVGNTTASKTMRIVNSSGVEILTMLDNGRLGLGQVAPAVRLDLRGTLPNPVVGIGTTSKNAASVGGGAIRYMEGTKEIHYSDGVQWFRLKSSAIRPCFVGVNDYVAGSYPTETTSVLKGYDAMYDSHNAFDVTTSIYTAPVDGLYVVSFTLSFNRAIVIPDNSYIEARWVSSNGNEVKAVQAYPKGGAGQAGLICTGTIQLQADDTIWPEIWHNLGGNRQMRVYGYSTSTPNADRGFNYLSIFSQ